MTTETDALKSATDAVEGAAADAQGGSSDSGADTGAQTTATASPAPAATDTAPKAEAAPEGKSEAAEATSDWDEKWREKAAVDKADLKWLQRHKSPQGLVRKIKELEKRLSEGTGPEPLLETASDEERVEWRKANNLPETADAYVENAKMPDGRVLGDYDRGIAKEFVEAVMPANYSQEQFNRAVGWYLDRVEKLQNEQVEKDTKDGYESIRDLHDGRNGVEVRQEMSHLGLALEKYLPDLKDDLSPGGRLLAGLRFETNGKAACNHAGLLKGLVAMSKDAMAMGDGLIPAGVGRGGATRRDELKQMRVDNPEKYYTPAIQAEEQALIAAELQKAR